MKGDPFWTRRFEGIDANGVFVRRGEEVLFFPRTGKVVSGKAAEEAWKEFQAQRFDEAQYNGGW